MELNLQQLRRRHVKNHNWPKEKKLQAVVQWLALGNMKLVEATTGVNYGLLRQWKMQPWWKEFELEVRNTDNLQLDTKLTKLVDKSLEAVADRLENGEAIWDSKTGTIQRKPVNMKDSAKVATDLLTKRELLRGNATSRTEAAQIPMQDQLKLLAAEFARMTGKVVIDVEAVEILSSDIDDVYEEEDDAIYDERPEGLREGGSAVQRQAGDHPESRSEECSPSGDGEPGPSP